MDYSSSAEGQNTCLKNSLSNYYDWIFITQVINSVNIWWLVKKKKKSSYHTLKIQLRALFGGGW